MATNKTVKPKLLYGAVLSHTGFQSVNPVKFKYNERRGCWVNRSLDIAAYRIGFDKQDPYIIFTSTDIKEAKVWMHGASTALKLVKSKLLGCAGLLENA